MLLAQVHLHLPPWIHDEVDASRLYPDDAARMALAVDLSRRNVLHGSGGPFGAAVFNGSGRLLGVGVNRVLPTNCSIAHAEMMAVSTTQLRTQRHRLNDPDGGRRGEGAAGGEGDGWTLATSAQPCAMCYGAMFWAGIDTLLIGARADDVQQLAGFDEGPLPADWAGELRKRGIAVRADLLRDEACAVLRSYGEAGRVY